MPQDVRVELPTGERIWVRLSETTGPADVGWQDDQVHRLEGLLETVRGVARSVRAGLHEARPDTVTVEFGVTMSAKTGRVLSVLAEAGAEANLKVTLSWQGSSAGDGLSAPPAAAG
ncbi:CU044_2847 family protein [Micromonospora sp. WMMD980]|uniref:CU044_2847 family protein n=1 Tax=Micromonospora sp. WMMD980 TaxID=3016088 RepID=UPI0024179EBB|nr:CU044_2847 family protein [Micromonospora sp. WMMD980]MDG4802374.1 CU044_2847 family protein [Micromonospora sp. WMMD980]